jgi:hypothetical protein
MELKALHNILLLLDNVLRRQKSTPLGQILVNVIEPEVIRCRIAMTDFYTKINRYRETLDSTIAKLWRRVAWAALYEARSFRQALTAHRTTLTMLLVALNS